MAHRKTKLRSERVCHIPTLDLPPVFGRGWEVPAVQHDTYIMRCVAKINHAGPSEESEGHTLALLGSEPLPGPLDL